MPKLKKKLTGNFTIINNTVLRDKRMGCTERGAYVTLVSMADDWNFSIRGLAAIMPDGVTKISGALKRLEALGYLRRERLYENGKIKDWVYYIYDEPCNDDTQVAMMLKTRIYLAHKILIFQIRKTLILKINIKKANILKSRTIILYHSTFILSMKYGRMYDKGGGT